MLIARRLLAAALVVLAAGCGGSARPSAAAGGGPSAPKKPAPGQFLQIMSAKHAVDLTLIASDGDSNNGFNFDDYGRGELLVSVPRGWRVTVHCKNDGPLRNSCAVVSGPFPTAPAFPGATTPKPVVGLESGQSASFSFVATRTGTYRLASLVAGHEQARMWDVLEVTRGGQPSISARPGP
ncbi:MAG: sulfocyanin-like copper-binding protein [Gaiellaceae bacterium]